MIEIMPYEELYSQALKFIDLRMRSSAQAWPRFGQGVFLAGKEEDGSAGSLLFSCRTDDSMSNPMGTVHGGITASLVDSCMGITCSAQCGRIATPTITMTVNYVRPVPLNADVLVRTRTIRVGRSTGQMQAEISLADAPDEILVTASGIYAIRR